MRQQIPPLDKIDIRLLRVFKVVAECGGFSAAEETLNLNRSTISIHIADLETRFGLRLCNRGPSGFSLTKHGEVVYGATLRLFNSINAFRSTVGDAKGRLMGELSIWLMDNMATDGESPIAAAIERFRARDNEVEMILNVAAPDLVEKAVHDGRCDIGITGSNTNMPGLDYRLLHSEEIALYCGERHPLFNEVRDGIDVRSLGTFRFVRRGFVSEEAELVQTFDNSDAISMHMEGTLHLIKSGLYLGYLPTHYAAFWEQKDQLRRIEPDRFSVRWPIFAVCRSADQQSALPSAFLSDLLDVSPGIKPARAPSS